MKRYSAILYLVICIPTLGWLALTYLARNTYFRRVSMAVEHGGDPYREAIAGSETLAWHLFGPTVAIVLLSMAVVIALLRRPKK